MRAAVWHWMVHEGCRMALDGPLGLPYGIGWSMRAAVWHRWMRGWINGGGWSMKAAVWHWVV
eukprot:356120-Chlamydomonas_euryale.AAC.23